MFTYDTLTVRAQIASDGKKLRLYSIQAES